MWEILGFFEVLLRGRLIVFDYCEMRSWDRRNKTVIGFSILWQVGLVSRIGRMALDLVIFEYRSINRIFIL